LFEKKRCTEEKNYRFLLCDTAVAVAASKSKSTAEKWEKYFCSAVGAPHPDQTKWIIVKEKKLVIGSTLLREKKRHKACIKFLNNLHEKLFLYPKLYFCLQIEQKKGKRIFFA